MFSIGINTTNENTFISCAYKFSMTDHTRYILYGMRYRFIIWKNCFILKCKVTFFLLIDKKTLLFFYLKGYYDALFFHILGKKNTFAV